MIIFFTLSAYPTKTLVCYTHLFSSVVKKKLKNSLISASAEGRGYHQTDDKQHEAGYDAYITGLCFLSMHSHLAHMRGEESRRVTADSALLRPFLNKVFLAKTAHQESPFMNLVGSDCKFA